MTKSIVVKNNEVVVIDNSTNLETVCPYCSKADCQFVIDRFTDVSADELPSMYESEDIVTVYKQAGDQLGCSVKQFCKMLNGAIYRAYIEPNKALHNRFATLKVLKLVKIRCNSSRSYKRFPSMWVRDEYVVNIINKRAEIINSYIDDGIGHMAGFGLMIGDSSFSKSILGKGLWKSLNKNSKTRNDLITKVVMFSQILEPIKNSEEFANSAKSAVMFFNKVPSTLLELSHVDLMPMYETAINLNIDNLATKIIKSIKLPMYKISVNDIMPHIHIIEDAHHVLGDRFNTRWSIKRIKKEHDKAVVTKVREAASPEPFELTKMLPRSIEGEGFIARLAMSPRDLAVWGNEEGHCVGSYHTFVTNGHYAVYKIEDTNTGEVSVLGVANPHSNLGLHDQHYHKFNRAVTYVNRVKFGANVAKKVRELLDTRVELN